MYVTATLKRKARTLDIIEEIMMERNGTAVVKHVAITLSPQATLVMVVEVIIAESEPLHIVLAVEQAIIAVFIGSIAIENSQWSIQI